ncbi:MAG TPA: hypothetical protein DHV62_00400, partial [Elusimicrobia bacterium]|nr:hypothetical protein [Elusimicrobiota bacterium]
NFSYDYEPGKNYDTWDRKENIYTFTNYLKIYPKTSLLTEYTYGQIKYPYRLGRDAEYHLFLTGVRGKLTAKLSGLVRFGYQIRNYQTLKDWQGLSIWTNLNEKFSSVNEVNLALERAINESEFTDENYYLANAISVNFSQIFPESGLNLGIGLNLRNEEYPKPVGNPPRIREDKIFGYSISLGYKFWRLPLGGLTYSSTQRNSNFNEYDYNTQTISLSIRRLF